jgi:hypothetical protein
LLLRFVVFAGHGVTAGREGEKRRSVFRSQRFWDVYGGAWNHAPPVFL